MFLLGAIGLILWLNHSKDEIIPPSERALRSGQDLTIPLAELSHGKARIFRVEDQKGGSIRLFVTQHDHRRIVVTFAACRRCERASRPSHVSNGQLIRGECGEPMPIPKEGETLSNERDCTPLPVQFRIDRDLLVVRAADIEAGRPLFAEHQN